MLRLLRTNANSEYEAYRGARGSGRLTLEVWLVRGVADHAGERAEKREMFSWLSTSIPDYPETLNLKMTAFNQEPGWRPLFRVERSDHPLAKEYYEGITPERVKDIMFRALPLQPE